ncbi:M14 family zinc carboxypeptidase [Terracoccus luteus]|uniref:Peptidase M14 domain-containing protein n=1 Tax=Terracoccus luteus TaxID=53356 RepID=A0A839PYY0_9MICO|nr:M14 family zinc carboxypeptidase [Terracoccus luteus]MBB2985992.1 hypothetical protein [Terracoccus luteus]MCP2171644.1 hypothetical protein [Terracoccus luteus]
MPTPEPPPSSTPSAPRTSRRSLARRTLTIASAVAVTAALTLGTGGAPGQSGGNTTASGSAFVADTDAPKVDVPTPAEFFGFAMGTEGKLAEFDRIKAYLSDLATASPEVDYEVVGTTTEGEEFPVVRLGSEANLARLPQILDINARLADPARMTQEAAAAGMSRDDYARDLAKQSVPVYYMEAGIHSTEVMNTQAVVDVVHRFATERSDYTEKVLGSMIVLVVPSQNPDGTNKINNYFNATTGTDFARIYPDLYQKYVGHDNNRDWFMFTQAESKIRLGLEQKYRPVVQHYMHGAGTTSPRIWSPPWDEPMSPVLDPLTVSSANAIGQEANRDLIAGGKKGAATDDAYGIMWNADVMGYSTFQGTTTWLTEIASLGPNLWLNYTADSILPPAKATLRAPLAYDSNTWTPAQTVEYAKTAAYSGLETVAGNPQEWLYRNAYQVNANSESYEGGPYAYVVSANQRDPYALYDMMKIFETGKVRIEASTAAFTAGGVRYPKGSYVLRTNQPLGRWVDQLLRVDVYPDNARKCSTCPLILPYSETTDNLGLLMGVSVASVEDEFTAPTTAVTQITPAAPVFPTEAQAAAAYVVSPTSYGLGKVITRLEDAGVPMYRASARVPVLGRTLPPGALLVPASADGARAALQAASAETGLPVYGLAAAPQVRGIKLEATTRVGLVRGANNMPGGWLRWMMEQYGVDVQVIEADDYADLAGQFDTVVLAPGISATSITTGLDPARYPEEFHWARGVPDGPAKLKAFVEGGGNLVALGSSSLTAASAMSLPVTNVTPTDRNTFTAPGALLAQTFDTKVPAAWGMPSSWPVWFNNDPAFTVTGDAQVASRYPDQDDLLVSGYARGSEAIGGAANIATFTVGKGQATIAGGHITFRTWPRAAWTVVTNAVYNGAATPVTARQMQEALR